MLKTEKWAVFNMEGAFRGMRNPKDSWEKHDSYIEYLLKTLDGEDIESNDPKTVNITEENFVIGPDDMKLAKSLISGGPVHRKFLRQILVSVDITAPLYWYSEFDTYKVATTANSCSKMHTVQYYPITLDLISHDHMTQEALDEVESYLEFIEKRRQVYVATGDKAAWYDMIQMIPESWNQKRTVTMNYETLYGMIYHRYLATPHKLDEWHTLCQDAIDNCPYVKELIVDGILDEIKNRAKVKNADVVAKHAELSEKLLKVYEAKYGELTEEDIKTYFKKDEQPKKEIVPDISDPDKKILAIRTIAFKPDKVRDTDKGDIMRRLHPHQYPKYNDMIKAENNEI